MSSATPFVGGGAGEKVVEELDDRAGPLAAGKVDHVVVAGDESEPIALDQRIPRRRGCRR